MTIHVFFILLTDILIIDSYCRESAKIGCISYSNFPNAIQQTIRNLVIYLDILNIRLAAVKYENSLKPNLDIKIK